MCIFNSTKNEFRTSKAFQKNDIIIIIININCCYIRLQFITITSSSSLLLLLFYWYTFLKLCIFNSTKNEFRTSKAFEKNDIIIIIININCCYIR